MAASSLTLSKLLTPLLPSPSPPSTHLSFPQTVNFPKISSVWDSPAITLGPTTPSSSSSGGIEAVAFPSLANANTLFFKSAYNVQVIPGVNEDEDKLLSRFRREVFKAGVLQECRRRRFFENSHDKRKRKSRDAARRNRTRKRFVFSFLPFFFSYKYWFIVLMHELR